METVWTSALAPGGKWSGLIGRGNLLKLTALEAGANVSLLLYNAKDLSERYNMPDTLKAQHTAHLTTGHVLMSDNGRVLASIVDDSLGWHDPLGGYTTRAGTDAKYGVTDYQRQRNDWLRSGQDNLTVELVRLGLGPRDLTPVVNLFSKISCDEAGTMIFAEGHCRAGAAVTLRTEMDVWVVLSNTPNPLDPRRVFSSVPVQLDVSPAPALSADDVCLNHRPENRRAFENTRDYYTLLGGGRA